MPKKTELDSDVMIDGTELKPNISLEIQTSETEITSSADPIQESEKYEEHEEQMEQVVLTGAGSYGICGMVFKPGVSIPVSSEIAVRLLKTGYFQRG